MVRKYVRARKRNYHEFSNKDLEQALTQIEVGVMSLRQASKTYQISLGTLSNRTQGRHLNSVGRKAVFTKEEEQVFAAHLLKVSEWGFPFDLMDLRYMVKSYLDETDRKVPCFCNNLPGYEWAKTFLGRHPDLSKRNCQNLKVSKSELKPEDVKQFFSNYEEAVRGIPPAHIFNYDETALVDDPGTKRCIFRRGTKYPERIINSSKSSTSIMFCGSADGTVLPPYVVYKAEHLWDSWVIGGPEGCRFNRSRSGWFDEICFVEWFESIFLPHAKKLGHAVLVGDNLPSHFSPKVLQLALENDITFICLPPDSTHLLQPLDVAFFAPMKRKWREILDNWKRQPGKRMKVIPKTTFPTLLKSLFHSVCGDECFSNNLKQGFAKCGLFPVDRERVLSRFPSDVQPSSTSDAVSSVVCKMLENLRYPNQDADKPKRRRIPVSPGKSVSVADLTNVIKSKASKSASPAPLPQQTSGVDHPKPSWAGLSDMMAQCTTYPEILSVVENVGREMVEEHPLDYVGTSSLSCSGSRIDASALALRPKDVPPALYPASILGDGNCFPRTISMLVCGEEGRHQEMRARLVIEAVTGIDVYLDDEYLERGSRQVHKRATMAETIVQYSDTYNPSMLPLTPVKIKEVYEAEVVSIAQPGSFMGLWQFFQASNILKTVVTSHYPERTNRSLRLDVNRQMYPTTTTSTEAHIMWTTSGSAPASRPNHFVPLLPIASAAEVEVVQQPDNPASDMNAFDNEDSAINISLSESVLDLFIPQRETVTAPSCGTHVLVKHGLEEIPAAISSTTPLSVVFFKRGDDQLWMAGEEDYCISSEDILHPLPEPQLQQKASRLYYTF